MREYLLIILFLCVPAIFTGCRTEQTESKGLVLYLGQPPPGNTPVPFAPDILPKNSRDVAFTPDGERFYCTRMENDSYTIMESRYESGGWTVPSIASFSGEYNDLEPCISAGGDAFYFTSMRPSAGKTDMTHDMDIWVMKRVSDGWSEPELLNEEINTCCMEYYPSVTEQGTLYFGRNTLALTRGDIYCSRYTGNSRSRPRMLPESVNLPTTSFNGFVARDESYIIFSTYVQDGGAFHSDLFISFRKQDGEWMEAKNMGNHINSTGNEFSPWVSHDNAYLFFTSTRGDTIETNGVHDIYWVSADIIKRHAPYIFHSPFHYPHRMAK